MHVDGRARQERQTPDVKPDRSAWAVLSAPALASFTDQNPNIEQWRGLRVDPDLVGLAMDRGRPSGLTIGCRERPDVWQVPVAGVLETPLAWHPDRPFVAGLATRGRRVYPWVADYRSRTVRTYQQVRAATSLVELGHPPLRPIIWYDDGHLLLLTPAPDSSDEDLAPTGPIVYEASGPAYVAFEPDLDQLAGLAGVTVSTLDLDRGSVEPLTPRLLVRGLESRDEGPLVEYVDEAETGARAVEEFKWSAGLVDAAGRSMRLRPTSLGSPRQPSLDDLAFLDLGITPSSQHRDEPIEAIDISTGHGQARLTVWPATAERAESGPALLWVQARRPGKRPVAHRPAALLGTGYAGAALDLPLHWPSDATAEMLHSQIVRAVRGSLDMVAEHSNGAVLVGGHSFGATLALYALAHVADLAAAIVHSGCYNRTLTPTGFQYERRPYWTVPDIYHAFSALLFADRIDRPVLIVHGAEDSNPATPPDQAVQMYQGVVAAGGRARLVLLPYEDHVFRYQETQQTLVEVHSGWLARWDRHHNLVAAKC